MGQDNVEDPYLEGRREGYVEGYTDGVIDGRVQGREAAYYVVKLAFKDNYDPDVRSIVEQLIEEN